MIPIFLEQLNKFRPTFDREREIKFKYKLNLPSSLRWTDFKLNSGKVIWYDWFAGTVTFLNPSDTDTEDTLREELSKEDSINLSDFSLTKLSDTTSYTDNEFRRTDEVHLVEESNNNGYRYLEPGSYKIDYQGNEFFKFEALYRNYGYGNCVCYDLKYRCGASKRYLENLDGLLSYIIKNNEGSSRYTKETSY